MLLKQLTSSRQVSQKIASKQNYQISFAQFSFGGAIQQSQQQQQIQITQQKNVERRAINNFHTHLNKLTQFYFLFMIFI